MVENKVLVKFHLRGWFKPSAFVSDNSICHISLSALPSYCRHIPGIGDL